MCEKGSIYEMNASLWRIGEFVTQNSGGCLPLAVGEKSRVAEYWKDAPSLNGLRYTNL